MKHSTSVKVLFVLPPWLPTPPLGYGGIETVAAALIPALRRAGVHVSVATPVGSAVQSDRKWELTKPLYETIHNPYTQVMGGVDAYIGKVLQIIRRNRFDVIHDFTGLTSVLNALAAPHLVTADYPAILHTLHGPLAPGLETYRQWLGDDRLAYVAISRAQLADAPANLARQTHLIYNCLHPADYRVGPGGNRLLVLGRLCRDKGQDRLVEACARLGLALDVAGTVAGISEAQVIEAEAEAADQGRPSQLAQSADFAVYQAIRPYLDGKTVKFHGNVGGEQKQRLLGNALALAIPNRWAEPFGMVAIEAMASGTPVVTMNSGALPELVIHGVTGYVANNWSEFQHYLQPAMLRRLHRAACRKQVEDHFLASAAARQHAKLYQTLAAGRTSPVRAIQGLGEAFSIRELSGSLYEQLPVRPRPKPRP